MRTPENADNSSELSAHFLQLSTASLQSGRFARGEALLCASARRYLPQNPSYPPALPGIDDVADAGFCPTAAWMQPPFAKPVPVVKREFLLGGDVSFRNDPDPAANRFRPAVRFAGVIDQPRDVPRHASIEIIPAIQFENVHRSVTAAALALEPQFLPAARLRFRDTLADVFNNPRTAGNGRERVDSGAVN